MKKNGTGVLPFSSSSEVHSVPKKEEVEEAHHHHHHQEEVEEENKREMMKTSSKRNGEKELAAAALRTDVGIWHRHHFFWGVQRQGKDPSLTAKRCSWML